ncbi:MULTISPECIES: cardiolipin synthase [unclassified Breznakia]|uniref:cardiolipin synthase n=1 Tax=unclassified Breznakia TaxID=2623764 RepID=UPI002473D35A|nr:MULTISPECIES: cardiolipin synthase [unclassified Breznakia]MDH6366191.1 cardiolipin synthase [Breznakia sp. PH1-1]MDH6403284.1 cardiolipin synthase [Breznakia sp. PF1-11]MDH6410993.1 cardiolipin synthase [Breznakia sp. PFB1-11]MDH6413357.1 cardiolipin synthase [Breznakia sp. PFB1-14]MDH6416122.1 cardiolipin synthase [Breznakia sp. PFB1-4]
MKQIFRLLTNKIVIVGVLILLQLGLVMLGVYTLSVFSLDAYSIFHVFSILAALYVINRNDNPSYKLSWSILILIAPVFGWLFYLMFGAKKVPKKLRERDEVLHQDVVAHIEGNEELYHYLVQNDGSAYKQINYIWNASQFPPYGKTRTKFFATGEENFAELMLQLQRAEKFIFMEYFIIDEGYMWDSILEVLVQKVNEGVDVRLIYDDFGCASKLPSKTNIKLEALGIKTYVFNPIRPRLAIQMNNRDHRKITVIDGKVAFSGGINIADEYINRKVRFGHWKDGGAMLEGEAVWSFTFMFLQFWNYNSEEKDNYHDFKQPDEAFEMYPNDGLVQPFSDTPTDDENVGEYTHINMINNATDYVYITTPYLVIDSEMRTALILAAKNGVDVRILVPHIPDKKIVFQLTRSNYEVLTRNGVRIYEYTPGFVHAKTFVSDDKYAIVGTSNMDFRSYYLHYECGIWFYKSSCIEDIKRDYLEMLDVSQEITYEYCRSEKLVVRMIRAILNVFSPLM